MWGECGEGEEVRLQVKRSRRGVNVKEGVIPGSDPESINVYLSNG